ncbi:MAG TPA: elongation factor Ts [Firmicutes bacterium]|nr:elongation factor Ts [Bacillota bacterium]
MEITATMVKELRERTGAGVMDCKRALNECNGDLEKAVAYLREKGLASAAKKAGRIAADGLVGAYVNADRTNGALVEVNCETDFVAKTDDFHGFVQELAEHIVKHAPKSVSAEDEGAQAPYLLDQPFKGQQTVGEYVAELVAKTGEKVTVRRFAHYQTDANGFVQEYIHMNGKIGVLIELAVSDSSLRSKEELAILAKDLAMQVAAAKPQFVRRADVPESLIEAEKKIYIAQAMNEGKPAHIAEKITLGRLNKMYQEICLEEQAFVKDNTQTIATLVAETGKKLGGEIKIVRFARYEKGEGIEKKSDDFAAEVMSQIKA